MKRSLFVIALASLAAAACTQKTNEAAPPVVPAAVAPAPAPTAVAPTDAAAPAVPAAADATKPADAAAPVQK